MDSQYSKFSQIFANQSALGQQRHGPFPWTPQFGCEVPRPGQPPVKSAEFWFKRWCARKKNVILTHINPGILCIKGQLLHKWQLTFWINPLVMYGIAPSKLRFQPQRSLAKIISRLRIKTIHWSKTALVWLSLLIDTRSQNYTSFCWSASLLFSFIPYFFFLLPFLKQTSTKVDIKIQGKAW